MGHLKLCLFLILALALGACQKQASEELVEIKGQTMGSYYIVKYLSPVENAPDQKLVAEKVESVLSAVNSIFNHYDSQSTLSRFNQKRDLEWMEVGEKFVFALDRNKWMSKKVEGFFDPTILPLTRAWGFSGDYRGKPEKRVLSTAETAELLKRVGIDKIEIDPSGQKIKKKVAGVELEFSASVPGLAADEIGAMLESELELKDYLIDVGGEMKVRGSNNGAPWKIAIEAPHEGEGRVVQRILELTDIALATSGNYRNYLQSGGAKLGHIFDATTGSPATTDILSVTVLSTEGAFFADLWSTALMALGMHKAYSLAEQSQIPAYFIYETKDPSGEAVVKVRQTSAMKNLKGEE